MRTPGTWSFALLVVLAACGEVPLTFIDAGGDGTCQPACGEHATCTDNTCACDPGYTGDGQTCTDANECLTDNGGCDVNALCTNVPGGRTCACKPGFSGDGLSCRQTWMLVGTLAGVTLDPENFGARAVAVGPRIFFAPRASRAAQFFRFFDTTNNTFSADLALPPVENDDFAPSGLGEIFVSDGTDIYMFGDSGQRYSPPPTNRWSTVAAYTRAVSRGESAGAFESTSRVVFQIGGRNSDNIDHDNAQRYELTTGIMAAEAGSLPYTFSNGRGWAPAGGNVTYVAGGRSSDNNGSHLASHVTGSGSWRVLADAPVGLVSVTGMGDFMGKIWVSTDDRLYFYEPTPNTWRSGGLAAPAGFVLAVTGPSGTYALAQNGAMLEIHQLLAIE